MCVGVSAAAGSESVKSRNSLRPGLVEREAPPLGRLSAVRVCWLSRMIPTVRWSSVMVLVTASVEALFVLGSPQALRTTMTPTVRWSSVTQCW